MSTNNKKYEIVIVLLNYQTPDLVIQCMESLKPEIDDLDAICCVVDNHSQDESVSTISAWIDKNDASTKFRVIASPENGGFSAGNNYGIKNNEADYYLLLNSDTFIRPGAIKTLLETANAKREVGLLMPRLEWPDGRAQKSCFRNHTPYSELIASAGTGLITRLFQKYVIAIPVSDVLSYPPWASFACVLIRREVIDQIGMLDEGYFMYFEDADFCFFARQAGWEIANVPAARIVHLRGGSSSVKSSFKHKSRVPAYYMAARSRYFYRVGGRAYLTMANLAWYIGRFASKMRELFGHSKMVSDKQAVDIWINWKDPDSPYKINR